MTHDYFISLQKSIYNGSMNNEWTELFAAYNKKNGTNLSQSLRCDHLTILHAIALKQKFNFNSTDVLEHSPLIIETNYEMREFWDRKHDLINKLELKSYGTLRD